MHSAIPILESESRSAAEAGLLHGLVVAAGTADTTDLLWAWGDAAVAPARKAMGPDSIFDVASLTKVVATATAAGICIDRGLLDPEADVAVYLPRISQFPGHPIRVCDLAAHCSGYDNRKFDAYTPDHLIDEAVEGPARWPARQCYEYACRNNVFAPLGMTHTCFGPILTNTETVVPTSQPAGTIEDPQARTAPGPVGNAGLFSTAGDLSLFSRMLLRGGITGQARILSAGALGRLMHPSSPAHLPRRSFGWDMRPCAECSYRPSGLSDSAIGHSGWTGQSMWVDPGLGVYTIVLTNRTHMPGACDSREASMRFRARIADILVENVGRRSGQTARRAAGQTSVSLPAPNRLVRLQQGLDGDP